MAGTGESGCYRSWVVTSSVGFLPRLKPLASSSFLCEDVYKVLVNVGGFQHVRTTGDHLILRWDPPEGHENTEIRTVTVPAHDSISIGTLHDIADDAGAENFEAFCEWIDENR